MNGLWRRCTRIGNIIGRQVHRIMLVRDQNAMSETVTTLPCGCKYQDNGYMVVRIRECDYHKKGRTRKRPYRPKAECVRP